MPPLIGSRESGVISRLAPPAYRTAFDCPKAVDANAPPSSCLRVIRPHLMWTVYSDAGVLVAIGLPAGPGILPTPVTVCPERLKSASSVPAVPRLRDRAPSGDALDETGDRGGSRASSIPSARAHAPQRRAARIARSGATAAARAARPLVGDLPGGRFRVAEFLGGMATACSRGHGLLAHPSSR